MISSIAQRTYIPQAAPKAPTQTPEPVICPMPIGGDHIDISNIDTAQKAAQLPILDPGFQLSMAGGIAVAIFSGMAGGSTPAIEIGYQKQSGANDVNLQYTIETKGDQPLTLSGSYNGQPASGALVIDNSNAGVGWTSKLGTNSEDYRFSADVEPKDAALHLDGTLGSVEAHLAFHVLGDMENPNPDTIHGYKVDGTLGGVPYEATTLFHLNQQALANPDGHIDVGTMDTTGNLGGLSIDKHYIVSADVEQDSRNGVATIVGSGVNAGVPYSSTSTVTVRG